MKLIHAHIENFGKLQNYDVDFTDGLNEVIYDNGWGKTTLIAFIRVMLYGFENDRKRSELENERKRFLPWQGGTYGGSLVFEKDGKLYRIERVFKNGKGDDAFALYDHETNMKSDAFSGKIGEELFKIDRDSFSKTVFIGQQSCATEVTSQINAKIGKVSAQTADMSMYDVAHSTLTAELNRLNPRRTNSDKSKLQNKIAKLESTVGSKERVEESYIRTMDDINECLENISQARTVISNCDRQLEAVTENSELRVKAQEYESKCEELMRAEEAFYPLKKDFPKGVPTNDEMDTLMTLSGQIDSLHEVIDSRSLSNEEAEEYDSLKKRFATGLPSKTQLQDLAETIEEVEKQRFEQQAGALSDDDYRQFEEYKKTFSLGAPKESDMVSLIDERNRQNGLENGLSIERSNYEGGRNRLRVNYAKEAAEKRAEATRKLEVEKKNAFVFLFGGAVIALLGFVFYFYTEAVMFLLFAIGGLIVSGVGLYNRPKNIMETEDDTVERLLENNPDLLEKEKKINEKELEVDRIKNERREFFEQYGLDLEMKDDMGYLYKLRDEISKYQSLQNRISANNAPEMNYHRLAEPVIAFFDNYGITSNMGSLRDDFNQLNNMINRLDHFNDDEEFKKTKRGEIQGNQEQIDIILGNYSLVSKTSTGDLTALRDKVIAYNKAKENLEKRRTPVEDIENEFDVSLFENLEALEDIDVGKLSTDKKIANRELTEGTTTLVTLRDMEDEILSELSEIEDAEEQLEELKEQDKELTWRRDIVEKTAKYLERSKANFLKHYLAPMQNAFNQYYTMLTGEDPEAYELDAELNITVRADGLQRNIGLLSEGYKDLVGLCRRMSMVDAMYEGEKPFLIFDDPFVNYDDKKLEYALNFLDAISQKNQVIYTTCHTSRKV